ncbi:MAG: hypothetical protein KBE16_00415 [Alphaproteobacteria bacterium]|nr:hypothetical protein [Alphaproteobacteria bacterium]
MSNDQKIMDKFVEQTQEILVLKDLNRKLKIENDRCKEIAERDGKDYSDIVRKLKIAVEALKDAHYNACSCCNSSDEVEEHCQNAIKEIEGSID